MMPPLILIAAYVAGGAGFTGFEPVFKVKERECATARRW